MGARHALPDDEPRARRGAGRRCELRGVFVQASCLRLLHSGARRPLGRGPDILEDLFILKRDINVVDAADVAEHDIENVALEMVARRDARDI